MVLAAPRNADAPTSGGADKSEILLRIEKLVEVSPNCEVKDRLQKIARIREDLETYKEDRRLLEEEARLVRELLRIAYDRRFDILKALSDAGARSNEYNKALNGVLDLYRDGLNAEARKALKEELDVIRRVNFPNG